MMTFCDEHGTSDYCTECITEPLDKRIAQLEAERDAWKERALVLGWKPLPTTPEKGDTP